LASFIDSHSTEHAAATTKVAGQSHSSDVHILNPGRQIHHHPCRR